MKDFTIEDIHKIREEHANLIQGMSFDEYKAELRKEIEPLLSLLKSMKAEQKKYVIDVEQNIAAEPELEYKTGLSAKRNDKSQKK